LAPVDTTPDTWASQLRQLEEGPRFRFGGKLDPAVPKQPGVYAIWRGKDFIYVGMAGRKSRKADVTTPQYGGKGLLGRLESHAHGRRSGDQFCVYVCDRFVLPSLSVDEIQEAGKDRLSLDALTRAFIHETFEFTFVTTTSGEEAALLERVARREGVPHSGGPFLNPLR
jgi:hypothetical protein